MKSPTAYDHVILISLDTLRSDCLGANPYRLWQERFPKLKMPSTSVLDDLAGSGAFFPNTISGAPYTSASHATVFTGQYPLRHGLYEFYNGKIKSPTIFAYGRMAGRRSILKVDFPVILGKDLGFLRDIDRYLVEDDDGFIDAVLEAKSSISCAHFGGIHVPYGFHNLRFGGVAYRNKVEALETMLPSGVPLHRDQLTETYRQGDDVELFLRYKRVIHWLYENGDYETLFGLYLEGIEHFLRARFAPFLDRLRARLDEARKTYLLVLFADHGHEFNELSFGNFNSLDEGVLRVPLIFAGHDVVPSLQTHRVRTADITPTVLDLIGLALPPEQVFDGKSLAATVRQGEPLLEDRPAVAQAYTAYGDEFSEFQTRQLSGDNPGPLRHVLIGEVAYSGQIRMVHRYFRYRQSFRKLEAVDEPAHFERFDTNLFPRPYSGPPREELLAMLRSYNSTRSPAEEVAAMESVRQNLRGMGYHV